MKIFHTWSKFLIVIFKLIIHASAIFMIMLIIYCIKTNPDFGMTDNKIHYDHIDYTAKSDVYDLRNFSNEITSIVRKYKSDAKLVNIAYIFTNYCYIRASRLSLVCTTTFNDTAWFTTYRPVNAYRHRREMSFYNGVIAFVKIGVFFIKSMLDH